MNRSNSGYIKKTKVVINARNELKVNIRKKGSVRKKNGDRSSSTNPNKKISTQYLRKGVKEHTKPLIQRSIMELWGKSQD